MSKTVFRVNLRVTLGRRAGPKRKSWTQDEEFCVLSWINADDAVRIAKAHAYEWWKRARLVAKERVLRTELLSVAPVMTLDAVGKEI